ncbi:unnamed protein product [Brachionus calyciflorus]|uniref:EF-hand domain-containing protein n=1 Tax=Brachionus calyciflorus TaxID=104777 RepID=A0A814D9Z2_9BILA|nr:unnamed protein product [Brachionus calyciflorus]
MSYHTFRNIAGIDNSIDRNEYLAYYQSRHPFSSPYSNYRRANEEFNLIDRNRNGRIEYHEYADAQMRKHGGYYPGQYSSGYGYY